MRLDLAWVVVALMMAAVVPLQLAFSTSQSALPLTLISLACSAAWMAQVRPAAPHTAHRTPCTAQPCRLHSTHACSVGC
jgi:hypothetical protein